MTREEEMKPIYKDCKWYCKCGLELDCDFIPPRFCDCGQRIDWGSDA